MAKSRTFDNSCFVRILFQLICLCFLGCTAKRLEGTLETAVGVNWAFLARFCFLSDQGTFEFNFQYPATYANQELIFYYDDKWLPVYTNESADCSEKVAVANRNLGQIVTLSPSYSRLCTIYTLDGDDWFNCTQKRAFKSSRERWWFIVIANCDSKQGLYMDYEIHMTNGDDGDLLHQEFSADEFYILPVDIIFMFLHVILLSMSVYVAVKLESRQLFHTTYKMFMAALALYTFHLFLMSCGNGRYGDSGLEQKATLITARIFEAASLLTYQLLLILIGKGYTITRGRLPTCGVIKIAVFMFLYTDAFIAVFIWEGLIFDPAKVLYIYDSIPGYMLLALRVIGWLWLLYAVFFTVKHYPEKYKFYIPFTVFYSLWFLIGPIIAVIALKAMDKWVREKVVNGVDNAIAFVGFLFLLILTWPTFANKHFPFHVRTSQIDIIEDAPHQAEDDEGFPEEYGGPYHKPDPETGPNFSELFVVSHTRSSRPDVGLNRMSSLPSTVIAPKSRDWNAPSSTSLADGPPSYNALMSNGIPGLSMPV